MHKVTDNQARQAVRQHKAQHKLARLQKLVARFEPVLETGPQITTGFAPIDAYLTQQGGGGLPCGGLHEVVAARPGDMVAALGFAYRLAARFLAADQAIGQNESLLLYGQTHAAVREGGQPYAPALAAHVAAYDKSPHLAYLDGVTLADLLWAGEEALSCPAVGCSVLASWDAPPDFTASRRLSLAARAATRPLIIALGAAAAGSATAATTRWQISAAPRQGWQVTLAKSRLAYQAMPPPQGWLVYPQHTPLPMTEIAPEIELGDDTPQTLVPLMAAQTAS